MGSPSRRTQREIPLISYLCSSQTLAASSSSSAFQEQISRSETIDWIHRAHTHTASPFIPFHVARSLVLRDPLVKCLGLMQAYAPRPRASPGILGLRCSDHQLCNPIAPGSLHYETTIRNIQHVTTQAKTTDFAAQNLPDQITRDHVWKIHGVSSRTLRRR